MRMWMTNPKGMCRQHLLGEHVETHMFVGAILKGTAMDGYVSGGLLESKSLERRHAALVREMIRRGMTHKSPLKSLPAKFIHVGRVDRLTAQRELLRRCAECMWRHREHGLIP